MNSLALCSHFVSESLSLLKCTLTRTRQVKSLDGWSHPSSWWAVGNAAGWLWVRCVRTSRNGYLVPLIVPSVSSTARSSSPRGPKDVTVISWNRWQHHSLIPKSGFPHTRNPKIRQQILPFFFFFFSCYSHVEHEEFTKGTKILVRQNKTEVCHVYLQTTTVLIKRNSYNLVSYENNFPACPIG